MTQKPPMLVDLIWSGDLKFTAAFPSTQGVAEPSFPALVLDGAGQAGPSPVAALAAALAGCMGIDLVHILTRGRHSVRGLRAHLEGTRSTEESHHFVSVTLRFIVTGDVPADAVERAIALSREKYCSVWHSLRKDIDFQVTFEFGA